MKSEPNIGSLVEGECSRDAIHIAVVPIVSMDHLDPGQRVGLRDGKAAVAGVTEHVGIVDPFLKEPVRHGQKFWLFLFPKTITSLRHVWEHPDFPSVDSTSETAPSGDKAASRAWLEDYVRAHCPYWEDEPDGGLTTFLGHVMMDRWIFYSGSDCHSLADVYDADELFRHLSVILDRRIDAHYFEAFTCSC